jgi:cyclase
MDEGQLSKTTKFADPRYVGDPVNTVRLFSEKGADEIVLLDVGAGPAGRPPDMATLSALAAEAFMPLAYGGGIGTVDQAQAVLDLGIEKVVLGRGAVESPELLAGIAERSGAQSVVACIDYASRSLGRGQRVVTRRGRERHDVDPVTQARRCVDAGAGEVLLQSVERDGTQAGYDLETIRAVSDAVPVPVIACGGAGSLEDLQQAVAAGASAVAVGSMFTFHGRHRAVLITYPTEDALETLLP